MPHLQISQHSIPDRLIDYIETNSGLLVPDVSSYAKGRKRAWIGCEGPLADSFDFQQSPFNYADPLWRWVHNFCITRLNFTPELALIHVGGASCGDPTDRPTNGPGGLCGIQSHRDAGYADYRAVGINICGEATFAYQEEYPEINRWSQQRNVNPAIEYVKMTRGTSVVFNCKNPHFAEVGPNRWCINA